MSILAKYSKMTKFKSMSQLMAAVKRGDIPAASISPGGAASVLGITRQAVHERIRRGTLRAWGAEGYIFIDSHQVHRLAKEKRGIAETQGELLDEST